METLARDGFEGPLPHETFRLKVPGYFGGVHPSGVTAGAGARSVAGDRRKVQSLHGDVRSHSRIDQSNGAQRYV